MGYSSAVQSIPTHSFSKKTCVSGGSAVRTRVLPQSRGHQWWPFLFYGNQRKILFQQTAGSEHPDALVFEENMRVGRVCGSNPCAYILWHIHISFIPKLSMPTMLGIPKWIR